MAAILLFLAGLAAVAGWWLAQQRLAQKPWRERGVIDDPARTAASPLPAAKIGLAVFLAVAGALFAMFVSAYFMRHHMGDWHSAPPPGLLWFNTGLLVVASLAFERAKGAANRDATDSTRAALLAAAAASLLFLAGQVVAWRQMAMAGFLPAASAAAAFFYLFTAVHGAHLVGGLVALGRAIARLWRGGDREQVRLSVELCTLYWHFLLVVWIVLFGLLLLTSSEGSHGPSHA